MSNERRGHTMMPLRALLFASCSLCAALRAATTQQTISIDDAVRLRLPGPVGREPAAVFSPDGKRLAFIAWHGDVERKTNVTELFVIDVGTDGKSFGTPRRLAAIDLPEDGANVEHTSGTAITKLAFSGDGRKLVFLSRENHKPVQVRAVDVATGRMRWLTNAPDDVTTFALDGKGDVALYETVGASPDDSSTRVERILRDGVFLTDPATYTQPPTWYGFAYSAQNAVVPRRWRRYVFQTRDAQGRTHARMLVDTRTIPLAPARETSAGDDPALLLPVQGGGRFGLSRPEVINQVLTFTDRLWGAPNGRYALTWPYNLANSETYMQGYKALADEWVDRQKHHQSAQMYSPYGLVDLRTGAIRALMDAPIESSFTPPPVWSPDGTTVLIFGLLPLEGDSATRAARAAAPVQWIEVDVESGRAKPVGVPTNVRLLPWVASMNTVLLTRNDSGTVGSIAKGPDGTWSKVRWIGRPQGVNVNFPVATNGVVAVGIVGSLTKPAELGAYDFTTREVKVLTDLNPWLRERRLGEASEIRWRAPSDTGSEMADAILIKPIDYVAGRRYPVAFVWTDGPSRFSKDQLWLSSQAQLTEGPYQPLAAGGIMVVLVPESEGLDRMITRTDELQQFVSHLESLVAHLDSLGMIDTTRMGTAGWSRSGFWTDGVLMFSKRKFAAAYKIEGGDQNYAEGNRPWRDDELRSIRTPLLVESNGNGSLVFQASMFDRVRAMHLPTEFLWIRGGRHNLIDGAQRRAALTAQLDWLRFWLQGYEDPAPEKTGQYARWRKMRAEWGDAAR
jgi:dipeptidyl aminopeptidase/acylaminoacyl peptidase